MSFKSNINFVQPSGCISTKSQSWFFSVETELLVVATYFADWQLQVNVWNSFQFREPMLHLGFDANQAQSSAVQHFYQLELASQVTSLKQQNKKPE